jgi:hypothetical protein
MLTSLFDVASHRLLGSCTGVQLSMRSCKDNSPLVNRRCCTNSTKKLRIFPDAAAQHDPVKGLSRLSTGVPTMLHSSFDVLYTGP